MRLSALHSSGVRSLPSRSSVPTPVSRAPAYRIQKQRQLCIHRAASLAGGGDGGAKDGGGSGGSGGGGGEGGGGGDDAEGSDGTGASDGGKDPKLLALFTAAGIAGRSLDSFPPDFKAALLSGKVPLEVLKRFLEFEQHFLYKWVWGWQGMRERLLADPSFSTKMGIEIGIGICTKLTAEKTKREDSFISEIDFVFANVVMAIIADWMLTWLPAPTLSYAARANTASKIPFASIFAGCPDNAFQKVQVGMDPFSVSQRALAIVRNGLKLLGVGFGASMIGVGLTNSMVAARQFLDPSWPGPPNPPQNVIQTSSAYAVYMAVSSNLRYQIMAGIFEERGIETIFKGQHQLCHVLSFILRTANTFLGSMLWVDFTRMLGMQKAKVVEPEPVVAKGSKGKK